MEKEISPSVDVYLTRTLRSHQAITNISEYSDLYFRNIFPCYIDENTLHFTLQKHTKSNYSLCDSIKLQSSIVEILALTILFISFFMFNISNNIFQFTDK